MPRAFPPPPTPHRSFGIDRFSYETRMLLGALAMALPAAAAVGIVVWAYPLTEATLATVIGVTLLMTLWLAARLRNRVIYPLYTLSNLLEALREGDYSLRGSRARRGDAIGEVIWEINALAQTLRDQRLKVEETNALLGKVIAATDIAIFTFDAARKLKLTNPAGQRLLARAAHELLDRSADELGLSGVLSGEATSIVKYTFPGGSGRFELRRTHFRDGGVPHELLAVTDLSRALREEERQAWQRLIRVLGHELNNSLAPIRSMAATLAKLSAQQPPAPDWGDDLRGGLAIIGDRAEALTRFMVSYTTLARLPVPNKRETDVAALLQRVARLEQRLSVALAIGPTLQVLADADQIEQALINLIKNAADASLPLGGVRMHWSVTASTNAAHSLCIQIEDDGAGLAATENLFVPFFTTKPNGSGIGLVLARQIAEAHGGTLTLENRSDSHGCIARMLLPLQ